MKHFHLYSFFLSIPLSSFAKVPDKLSKQEILTLIVQRENQIQQEKIKLPSYAKMVDLQKQEQAIRSQGTLQSQLSKIKTKKASAIASVQKELTAKRNRYQALAKNGPKNRKAMEGVLREMQDIRNNAKAPDGTPYQTLVQQEFNLNQQLTDYIKRETDTLISQINQATKALKQEEKNSVIINELKQDLVTLQKKLNRTIPKAKVTIFQ